jgi:hypothetical protein
MVNWYLQLAAEKGNQKIPRNRSDSFDRSNADLNWGIGRHRHGKDTFYSFGLAMERSFLNFSDMSVIRSINSRDIMAQQIRCFP